MLSAYGSAGSRLARAAQAGQDGTGGGAVLCAVVGVDEGWAALGHEHASHLVGSQDERLLDFAQGLVDEPQLASQGHVTTAAVALAAVTQGTGCAGFLHPILGLLQLGQSFVVEARVQGSDDGPLTAA